MESKVKRAATLPFCLAISLISFLAITLASVSCLLWVKCPVYSLALAAGLVGFGLVLAQQLGNQGNRRYIVPLLFAGYGLLLAAFITAGWFHDDSIDGQWYQEEGMLQIANGWQIYHQPPLSPDLNSMTVFRLRTAAKGMWMLGASLYAVTGNLEMAKGFGAIVILSAFLFAWDALLLILPSRSATSPIIAVALALVASANPIALAELPTFYPDGIGASLATCFVSLLLGLSLTPITRSRIAALCLTLFLILNIRISTAASVGIITILGLSPWFLFRMGRKLTPLFKALAATLIVAIGVVGYNPYLTNWQRYHNPLYPIFSTTKAGDPGQEDMVRGERPEGFDHRSGFKRLILSLFSETANPVAKPFRLKLPFVITAEETKDLWIPDNRIGGFGPWFSGILIFALIVTIFTCRLVTPSKSTSPPRIEFVISALALGILISVISNPEAWCARYAPQLWLFPVLILILGTRASLFPEGNPNQFKAVILAGMFLAMSGDALMLFVFPLKENWRRTQETIGWLGQQKIKHARLHIAFDRYSSQKEFLTGLGVRFTAVPSCAAPVTRLERLQICSITD